MRSKLLSLISAITFLLVISYFGGCAARRSQRAEAPPDKISHAVADEAPLYVGAAVADITPESNVWMAGFGFFRRSRAVHDPLEVRAVVIRRGDVKIALVSMDLLGIMKPVLDGYVSNIDGFDDNDLVLTGSSHTHSGPDTMGYWGGVDESYTRRIGAAMKTAVETADKKAVEAKMLAGTGRIPDGAIKNVRQTDLVDPRVEVLQFISEAAEKPIALIVNYACHPEVMWGDNHTLTSDFVHAIRRELEKDGRGTTVYFNGALGAMVTPDVWRNEKYDEIHTFEEVERIASIMLKGVRKAVENAAPVETFPMRWARIEFVTPVDNPVFEKAANLGLFDREIYAPSYVLTETAAVRLGDAILVTMPGEARPDIGLKIKSYTQSPHPIFIGLGNDELGYILPEDAFDDNPMYVYEPTMSTGKASNIQIVEQVMRAVDMVK